MFVFCRSDKCILRKIKDKYRLIIKITEFKVFTVTFPKNRKNDSFLFRGIKATDLRKTNIV